MRAAVFVRYEGADGLGHVGWGFDIDGASAHCGSVENPLGIPYCPVGSMGFWDAQSNDPVAPMMLRKYDDAKVIDLGQADPSSAYCRVLWVAQQPYLVCGRNCLDDVYDVLRSYGVPDLPPPSTDWNPNEWFGLWRGNSAYLHLDQLIWNNRPAQHATNLTGLASPVPIGDARAQPPPWRTVGTPQFEDLQAQLAAVSSKESIRRHAARYYKTRS